MNTIEDLEYEINKLQKEIDDLKSSVSGMQDSFIKLSAPIIEKAVRYVEKTLRHFPPEANLFGDDSKLNFFEEVCVMQQEDSMDNYDLVRSTIESVCKDAFDILSADEQYILCNTPESYDEIAIETITAAFFSHVNNYSNKRIEDSFWRRNLKD